jgi:hypothetical protein
LSVHAPFNDDPRRITDLRRAQPADATLQNLLQLLNEKIELCGRLAVYEYEAASERHFECAASFRALATAERASYQTLLESLVALLADAKLETPDTARPGLVPRLSTTTSSTAAGE